MGCFYSMSDIPTNGKLELDACSYIISPGEAFTFRHHITGRGQEEFDMTQHSGRLKYAPPKAITIQTPSSRAKYARPSSEIKHILEALAKAGKDYWGLAGRSVKDYWGFSKKGFTPIEPHRTNQDALLMLRDRGSIMLGVLDGHGAYGEDIAEFIRAALNSELPTHPLFNAPTLLQTQTAITDTISIIEEKIQQTGINLSFSGTTLCLLVFRKGSVIVTNIGDSRAVLVSRTDSECASLGDSRPGSISNSSSHSKDTNASGGMFRATQLSIDHRANIKEEYDRITTNRGRVTVTKYADGSVGHARVYLPSQDIPGLRMSRSLGDAAAHGVGVISTPHVVCRKLDVVDVMVIVASDGLWEYVSNDEAAQLVGACTDAQSAVMRLINLAHERWTRDGPLVDDITVCIALLSSYTPTLNNELPSADGVSTFLTSSYSLSMENIACSFRLKTVSKVTEEIQPIKMDFKIPIELPPR